MTETIEIPVLRNINSSYTQTDFTNINFGHIFSDHMFSVEYVDGHWANPKIIPYQSIKISPANPGLHYGISVFEGLKAVRNVNQGINIFRPEKNFERLNLSAQRMCMPTISKEFFFEGLFSLLSVDSRWVSGVPNTSLYIRPFMFSNDGFLGIRSSNRFKFMIITAPVGKYYAKNLKIKIEDKYVRCVEGGSGSIKTGCNYGPTIFPATEALKEGFDQLLWRDGKEKKYIEESGTMNIMMVIDGKVVTPSLGDTVLNGITRDSVITIAKDWGLEVEERKVSVQEFVDSIENGMMTDLFGLGTAASVAPIELVRLEGKDYELPKIDSNSFSLKIKKELEDIKRGVIYDRFGWVTTL